MKHISNLLGLLLVVGFYSCESSSTTETMLSLDKTSVTISADGGSETIHITCNTDWTITTDNADISITPNKGSGNADVVISLEESWETKDKNIRLMVATSDGKKIENVNVTQKTKFTEGVTIQITNQVKKMVLGGEAGNIDSLVVLSNIPWQLKGPEWIEAWDGNHWVSLSPTRSMINSGMGNIGEEQTVRLRTAGDNQSDANLTGYFSITPLYDSDVEVELDVIQLGKYNVAPDRILVMCHSAAATWKTGIGVNKYYVCAFNKEFSDSDFSDETILSWDEYTRDYLLSLRNLEDDKKFYLYTAGLDEGGKFHVSHYEYTTPSESGQALAAIVNVSFDGNWLEWDTEMNENCVSYFQMIYTNMLEASDAEIAWHMYYDGNLSRYMDSGHFGLHTNYEDVQIITWGIAPGSNILSCILGRYITDYWSSKSETRRFGTSYGKPVVKKFKPEDLEKSIIQLK